MAFLVDLKPMKIKKLQKKLQRERDIANRKVQSARAVNRRIQKNPIETSKFQID